jgi:vitamin B12 transporter
VYPIINVVQRGVRRGCYYVATRSVIVLSAPLFFTAAFAQDSAPPTQSIALPPITVSATTIPTPTNQVASSVTVITAEDLERDQRRTVPDALNAVPGLNVVQTGGPGGQASVFMRGTNSNHVKVFIDGIDASDPSNPNGAFDFAHLLSGDIERIEVLRGPQSGLYGSDAIGGVISITTKKGEGPPKVTAILEGGSFGTFNQAIGLSGSQANFNYVFNVQHTRSTSTPVTPLNLLAPGEMRNNDSYNNWTYSTKLGADLSENVAVNLVGRYTDAKLGFTGDNFGLFPVELPEAMQSTQVNHNLYTRGEVVWSLFDNRFKNFFGMSYTNQWNFNVNPNPDFASNNFFLSPSVGPPTTNLGVRTKYDWRGEAKLVPGQTLVLGLERQTDSLRTDTTGTTDFPFGNFIQTTTTASTGNKAGYIELQSEFSKRLFLVSNIRYDDNESFGPHTTWRLAPVFIVPGTETKLKATYGTGFKAPSLNQLFVNNPSFLFSANPNLLPELSKGYDFGFEQSVLHDRLSFGATYFHNSITNLINFVTTDPLTGASSLANIGLAKTHGVEAFASVVVTENVKVRGDYTATRTRDETTGLELTRRPRNKASLSAIWTPIDRLSLSTTVLYVGSWVDINRNGSIPRLDAPQYTTVNIAANYEVDKHVAVFARADNLFNYQYQDPTGFMRPGLGVFGGVRVSN